MSDNTLIVTPTVNRPYLCKRAGQSLLAQSDPNWTWVIAKNGGSHKLSEYAEALERLLEDKRVYMLVLPERGLAYALNQALSRFGHEAPRFANLEDDDEFHEHWLKKMKAHMSKTHADVVHCMQRQEPEQLQAHGRPMDQEEILVHNWINWPMCLIRTSLIHRVGGFTPEAGPAVDWDFHLRAVRGAHATYSFLNERLVTHHWHENNYCREAKAPQWLRDKAKAGGYDRS